MKKIKLIVLLIGLFFVPLVAKAQSISDYLIVNDIGTFKMAQPEKSFITRPPIGGPTISDGSGILSGSGHFPDHPDKSYKVLYIDSTGVKPGTEVEVTQHTGGDSDGRLRHEIENSYRSMKNEKMGLPYGASVTIREINGSKIIYGGLGGGQYTWLSNNVVVEIEYTDLQRSKPEPIEVVQAYLVKFPSTITTTSAEFKSNAYNVQWIMDEMDRRLWLCGKWILQPPTGQMTQQNILGELSNNMQVFLNYREKYFADITASNETEILYGFQKNNDIASMQKKLTEYNTWWNANKSKAITLP
ncbi:MAG: hypothetical protein ABSF20_00980 [Smithella sp.]